MKDEKKTKKQLIRELVGLRKEIAQLEALQTTRKRAKKTPAGRDQSFKALADNAHDGILIASGKGLYIYANKRAAEITGYSVAELLKIGMKDLTHPDEVKKVKERFRKRLEGKPIPRQYETVIVRKDGKSVPIEITAAKMVWQGRPAGLAIFRDITERKKARDALRESERRFRDITANALEWIWEVDANGKYTYASPGVKKILGYKPEEVLKKHFFNLFHSEDRRDLKKVAFEVFAKKRPFREFINRNVHKNGRTVWLSTSGVPVLDEKGNLLGYRGADTDITERKRAEEELKKYREQLEELVVERTAKLKEANKQLRQEIEERKLTEKALIETKARLEYLLTSNPAVLYTSVAGGDYAATFISENVKAQLGYEPREFLDDPKFWTDRIHPEDRDRVFAGLSDILKKKHHTHEYRFLHKDGTYRWMFDELKVTSDALDKREILGYWIDITGRKEAEDMLRESEERYKELANSLPQVIYEMDEKGNLIYVNQNAFKLFGYTKKDFDKGLNAFQMFIPEDRDRAEKNARSILSGETMGGHEYTARRKDGSTFPVVIYSSPIVRDNKPVGLRGIVVDITELKLAEEELRESQERLQILFEYAPEAYFLTDTKGTFIDSNRAVEEISGYTKEELIGKNFMELNLIPPEHMPKVTALIAEGAPKQPMGPREFTINRKDCSQIALEVSAFPVEIKGKMLVLNIARDITERKLVEEVLRVSEERFRSTFEQAAVGIAHVSPDGRFLRVNRRLCEIVGYTRNELLQRTFQDITHPDDLDAGLEYVQQMLAGEIQNYSREKRYICKDGLPVWVNLTVSMAREPSGDPKYFITVVEDITERKWAEQELISSTERLKIMFEYAPEGYYLTDVRGTFVNSNRAMEEMSGYSKDELIGKNILKSKLLPPKQVRRATALLAKNSQGHPTGPAEFIFDRKDGNQIAVEISAFPVEIEGQTLILNIARDITERKHAEQALRQNEARLRQVQKLAHLGSWEWDLVDDTFRMSDEACLILGFTDTSVKSFQTLLETIVYPDDREFVTQLVEKVHEEGRAESVSYRIVRPGEEIRWVFVTMSEIIRYGKNGKSELIIGTIQDITEHKRTEKALRRAELQYRTTIDSMSDAIHVVDPDLRFVFCNKACNKWAKELGLEMGTSGQYLFEAFPFLSDEIRDEYQQVFNSGKKLVTEEFNEVGGKKFVTEVRKIPVLERKQVVRVITIVRDITEQKKAKQKRK